MVGIVDEDLFVECYVRMYACFVVFISTVHRDQEKLEGQSHQRAGLAVGQVHFKVPDENTFVRGRYADNQVGS